MKNFAVVVAATSSNWGIGKNGNIPWKLAEDLKFFKDLTTVVSDDNKINALIMGRKTYESIPKKFRPLRSRMNIVISRNGSLRELLEIPDDVIIASSLSDALSLIKNNAEISMKVEQVFVIGGESIYRESITMKECSKIYLTSIEKPGFNELDTFFPVVPANKYQITLRSNLLKSTSDPNVADGIYFRFTEYESIGNIDRAFVSPMSTSLKKMQEAQTYIQNPVNDESSTNRCVGSVFKVPNSLLYQPSWIPNYEEEQYLDIIRNVLKNGVMRGDRTGTGTVSVFGAQMRFNLRNNIFPLLTTKKVFWRGVAEELLWFVKGSTNAKLLEEKDIHIWDGNGSREFLDKSGLSHREEGDLGPVYGFQWRHFGAVYDTMHSNYTGKGIDQLKECIRRIKDTPEDRRIVLTAWNPADLPLMALPPCHMFAQFYVANGELSCQMYQRSADLGLGVPFNIASYSLLTAMIAQVCGLKPGDFVHTIGDAHVYTNHIEALRVQLERVPQPFPRLYIDPAVTGIDAFQFSDFRIEGYTPEAAIKMTMAV